MLDNLCWANEGLPAITWRTLEMAENYYPRTKIVINFFFRSFTRTKICPLCGHILIARSSLRSQVWARLGRAIRSSRFALRAPEFLNVALCAPFFLDLALLARSCALRIHLSLFLIFWYWSWIQFYNNITDDVNYTFSQSHWISFSI